MVFVKVRETYDLHTTKNKMTIIGIHTPKPSILKMNYPGLLMQCRTYRPVSADVRLACASVLPLDPQGVGLAEGDVAPEDVFNPILYKAMSNKGMSQLEARINRINTHATAVLDVDGSTAGVDVDTVTAEADEFPIYYGLLSNTHDWRHANPQAGLEMKDLRPFVYEMVYNVGDMKSSQFGSTADEFKSPDSGGYAETCYIDRILGKAKEMPFIPCTSYSLTSTKTAGSIAGFPDAPYNCAEDIPWINVVCGVICVPPSRLHELFFRMVVEWTVEFSQLRPIGEVGNWNQLAYIGSATHYQNYSYAATKEALTGESDTILENDTCMVSTNGDIKKVM